MATVSVNSLTIVLPLEIVFLCTKDEVPEEGTRSEAMLTVLAVPCVSFDIRKTLICLGGRILLSP